MVSESHAEYHARRHATAAAEGDIIAAKSGDQSREEARQCAITSVEMIYRQWSRTCSRPLEIPKGVYESIEQVLQKHYGKAPAKSKKQA
jgi:hypothetical protein